jgi:glyoxylase-like metal-dependent hydrolase (beta-lactamase superfamily II)
VSRARFPARASTDSAEPAFRLGTVPDVVRLTADVQVCRGRASNVYLVTHGAPTLVDAGTPWDLADVRALLDERGLSSSAVERVLLTHYDLDHVGILAALDLECPIFAAAPDAAYLSGVQSPPWTSMKGVLQRLSTPFIDRPDLSVVTVEDLATVGGFTAHHTPGHTAGHLTWVHEGADVAFVGDLVRERGGRLQPSPWYLSADTSAVRRSIRRLHERRPAVEWLCPGHGDPIGGGIAALPHP